MFRIYPYRTGSRSVRILKDSLEAMSIRLRGSRYQPRDNHIIINWGNSRLPQWWGQSYALYINNPESVAVATNKLTALQELQAKGVPTVSFTSDTDEAQTWLDNGSKVFVRNKLDGHSGEGLVVFKPQENLSELIAIANRLEELNYSSVAMMLDEEMNTDTPMLPEAPLYTQGVENRGEYRVHVVGSSVILYQKKSRRYLNEDEVDAPTEEQSDVRNLASGWVYRTGNLKRLERVEELAVDAIKALGLDFGAVDIIMDNEGLVYVLEINTAPGLGNTDTREAYVSALLNLA